MAVDTWDVVVVGGGGSGLAAAAEAAKGGAKVLVVEKDARIGGTTAWSVGAYTSSSTPHQRRAGVVDDPDQHFKDMDLVNANADRPDNLVLRRLMTHGAPETFRWLMDLGIEFVGPNPEAPHTRPRMHNVVPGAAAYIHFVGGLCRKLGVTIECQSSLTDLVRDGGRITGVEVERPDGRRIVHRARRAVILASGDFSGNKAMRARFFRQEVVNAEPINAMSTGEGIVIGERIGARIVNGDYSNFYIPRMRFVPPRDASIVQRIPPWRIVGKMIQLGMTYAPPAVIRPFLMRFITTALGPEPSLFRSGAALINVEGRLIEVDLSSPARHLALDPPNKGYIVFDSKIAAKFEKWPDFVSTAPNVAYAYLKDYRTSRRDIYFEAQTLAELADKLGIERGRLEDAVVAHNQRQTDAAKRHEQPPYYALGPVRGYLTTTEGGLAVDERLRVLDGEGRPFPGLFAAGSAGQGGVILDGHGHHITWAFVSGRHAGQSVLRDDDTASANGICTAA